MEENFYLVAYELRKFLKKMYPAITLTILILMLLHSSNSLDINCTSSNLNLKRLELRELSLSQIDVLLRLFNSTNINVKLNLQFDDPNRNQSFTLILDELLKSKFTGFLMPYWDYRIDFGLPVPLDSIMFHLDLFKLISTTQHNKTSTDKTLNADRLLFETATKTVYDSYDKELWSKRKNAYDMLEQLDAGILWKLLFYVTIENELDTYEEKWQQINCDENLWMFWNPNKSSCIARIANGKRCVGYEKISKSCYKSECILRKCRTTVDRNNKTMTTTFMPKTSFSTPNTTKNEQDQVTEVLKQINVELEWSANFTIEPINGKMNDMKNISQVFVGEILEEDLVSTEITNSSTNEPGIRTSTSTQIKKFINDTAQQILSTSTVDPKIDTTTETPWIWNTDGNNVFSSTTRNNYTSTMSNYYEKRKKEKRKNRKNKNKKYKEEIQKFNDPLKKYRRKKHKTTSTSTPLTTTTMRPIVFPPTHANNNFESTTKIPIYIDDIVPFTETSWLPMPPANEETNLDNLLHLLPTPSMPDGTILWNDKTTPFDMVYFTITIVEGSMNRKEPPKKKAIGARIYLIGLNMPSGYTQITEVENRYGSPCKQMCLDAKQKYRRCARRMLRLSTHKKFSDPILYFKNLTLTMNAQWTGRGYYRKRKLDYILFKCE